MTGDLLPSNATPLEIELANASVPLDAIDVSVIETIWDAWRCPSQLLPWLAWSLSLDTWDDGWSEVTKRQTIADAPEYHRIKGTRLAVDRVLVLLGSPYSLTEWWERTPPGRRGTARLHISTDDIPGLAALRRKAQRLAYAAKPKSRSIFISMGPLVEGDAPMSIGIHTRRYLTVDPFKLDINDLDGPLPIAAAIYTRRHITIEASL